MTFEEYTRHIDPLVDSRKLPGMAAGDIPGPGTLPTVIGVRGARHNNLGDVDVDVPLWRTPRTPITVGRVPGTGMSAAATPDNLSPSVHPMRSPSRRIQACRQALADRS